MHDLSRLVALGALMLAACEAPPAPVDASRDASADDSQDALTDGALDAPSDLGAEVSDARTDTPVDASREVPDPWGGALRLARFEDRDPDPRVLEVNLEARPGTWELSPGRSVRALTYNGTVPGPVLEGRVGDRVVVHFRNGLDAPTTVHWHGLRVPADMDGTHFVHAPIPPGGTFEYRFELLDAGTFWYHPHHLTAHQVEQGLYGAIVVRGPAEPVADAEGLLLLDDVFLTRDGAIGPEVPGDVLPGRTGDLLLVNGRVLPTMPVRAGATYRLRVLNAANARYFRLGAPDGVLALAGHDASPRVPAERVDDLLLVPGQRAEVLFTPTGAPGGAGVLRALPYNRGPGSDRAPLDLLPLAYAPGSPLTARPVEDRRGTNAPVDTRGVTPRTVRLAQEVGDGGAVRFTINGAAYPAVPPIRTRIGATEVWDVVNDTPADHPFHLHGFFFQVEPRGGTGASSLGGIDTLNVPARQTVRIAFRPERHPGMWMYHCHILEHAEHGMIGDLVVDP
jgi:FtsP/CotA-like multicopper oxidase with cupredoxin domain